MPEYINEKHWQHTCRYGTVFDCVRCDFKAPIEIRNCPRSEYETIDGERLAADVAEMISCWMLTIYDKLDAFSGFDTVKWDLK